MITVKKFDYPPEDYEAERSSNSYLMALIAVIGGIHIPLVNLIASLIFFLGNRKSTYFVRWHCTQALVSQLVLLIINGVGFCWTISIILGYRDLTSNYFGYIFTIIIFNIIEFIINICTAIQTRKGIHLEWWIFGPITNLICKPQR